MSRRATKAVIASVAVHALALAVLAWRAPLQKSPLPTAHVPAGVVVDIIEKTTRIEAAPPVIDIPLPRTRRHRAALEPPAQREDAAGGARVAPPAPAVEQTAPPTDQQASGEQADRLWSFRPLGARPVPRLALPADDDARTLYRHEAPNVVRNAPTPRTDKTLEGRGGAKMHLDDDGHIRSFESPKPKFTGLGATFDVNDALIRAAGGNPYRYEEHRLAETTREQRICQMMEAAKRNTREALFNLKQRLADLWQMDDLTLARRHELLFELWDECVEDDRAVSAGAMARATIEAFVREHMPAGTPNAYSPAELALLNRRRTSRRQFAPYQPLDRDAGAHSH